MDIAYLTEFVGTHQLVRHVVGEPEPFGLDVGTMVPLESGYCRRVVRGELEQVVCDTSAHPLTAGLPFTAAARIGAYVGVPVHPSDGPLYGTLCCASSDPRPELAERNGWPIERVVARLRDGRGAEFDPDLVDRFLESCLPADEDAA